jgi:RNA polymerase sigma-54 factor
MALELKQQLKLTQQLIMTPQLQQALKILQMPRLELREAIQVELRENPVLEEEIGLPEEPQEDSSILQSEKQQEDRWSWESLTEHFASIPDQEYTFPYHEEEDERPSYEQTLSKPQSFTDYLIWQLRLSDLDGLDRRVGLYLIGNLDDDGYLTTDLERVAEEFDIPVERVEKVLKRIQEFDPPGIAARDLQECLLIQMSQLGMGGSLAERIVKECMKDLEAQKVQLIARKLKAPLQEVIGAIELIKRLEPKPGRLYSTEEPHYITPDVFVFKFEDEYIVLLNDDGLPKLRINPFYSHFLKKKDVSKETRSYVQEKLNSALWLIRSIHQRQRTIYKVTQSIVKFQREFLDKGIDYLRPLVLRDVALDTDLSESTISRVVTNKYVQTPQGLFELKFFFNSGIQKENGEAVASQSVKEQIRRLIQQEDPKAPLSDQEIADILTKRGFHIARRTVAKYRTMMGFLPSSSRKRPY